MNNSSGNFFYFDCDYYSSSAEKPRSFLIQHKILNEIFIFIVFSSPLVKVERFYCSFFIASTTVSSSNFAYICSVIFIEECPHSWGIDTLMVRIYVNH
jgi:hypothetical protein